MAPFILTALLSLAISNTGYALPGTSQSFQTDDCIVKTTSGSIRPLVEKAFPDVEQFLGVPFAQPPLGDLRFAPPQPYKPTTNGVFNATVLPLSCPAVPGPETIFDVYEPGLGYYGPTSEDCLKLDIYRPRKAASKPLPVLIFVYGGGFITGAANKTFTIPTPWVQNKQNIIIVAIQYRANIFGFPNSAALTQNNVGLEDIRFAVEWVKDNAAAFGGDTTHMTLWGHSAGSIATNAYTFSYPDNMIVDSTISTSGTVMTAPEGWQSRDYKHSNFTFVAHQLGCSGNDAALLSCMRKKTTSSITDVAYNMTNNLTFKPFPDGKLVFANYTERLMDGNFAKQSAIIGNSRREGERSLDKNLDPNGPNQFEALAYTVVAFLCPGELVSKYRHAAGVPTYRYEFKANFTNISPLPWMGAYHGSPLPYFFGQTSNEIGHPKTGPSTPFELEVSSHMQDLWQAFTADPNSLKENWDWPLYEGGAPGEMVDAVKLIPGRDPKTVSSLEYGARREKYCAKIDPLLLRQTLSSGSQTEIGSDMD